ncbi:hypothetical protein [Brochothrix thermosphacta]|uniref:hypothetical protein n=1 Tax=Brochothrix thermosphacta TaxID=2756 RepID=UPI00083FC280|nr:hypothetical protein [Brochothrix thermosphacta]ODJ71488.1 hypothetical protein BFR39_05165 [Brochothrix thermosphacta]
MSILDRETFHNENQTNFIVVKITEVECVERKYKFKNVGHDIALRGINEDTAEKFEKIYSISNDGQSYDNNYIKPLIRQARNYLAGNNPEEVDLSKLQGERVLIGIDTKFSSVSDKSYDNIVVFIPLTGSLLQNITTKIN